MFDAISGRGGIVSLMIGDGLMAIFGAPLPLPDHCESAVRAGLEMIEMVELFDRERAAANKPQIRHVRGPVRSLPVEVYAVSTP